MIEQLHFLRPWWFLALSLLPLLWWVTRTRQSGGSPWTRVVDPKLLPYLLDGKQGDRRKRRAPLLLVALALVLLVSALAGPAWRELPQPVFRDQAALVIALDLSQSMDAGDLAPTRLARARLKLIDILGHRAEGQTALVAYAGRAFVVSPLTDDADTIKSLVSSMTSDIMPVLGSRADHALSMAGEMIDRAALGSGEVLLITDGVRERDVQAARDLASRGIAVSVLAVGTPDGAAVTLSDGSLLKDANDSIVIPRLDEPMLRAVSSAGGGRYSRLRLDGSDLNAVLPDGGQDMLDDVTDSELNTDLWHEEGPWLVLLLLPIAALAFRRGVLVLLVVLCLPVARPAYAFEWDALWKRDDQRGVEALQQGEYEQAQALLAQDPQWVGAAQYLAGQFEDSAQSLASPDSQRGLYNLGNALARTGQLQEAIQAYSEVLEANPGHEDAAYNLELLRELMQQQQQQQSSSSDGEQSDEQEQSSQDDSESQQGESQSAQGEQDSADQSDAEQQSEQERQAAESEAEQSQEAQEQERQAQQGEEEGEQGEKDARMAQAESESMREREEQAAVEQWLRRIPDDPGGLLRRKFLYQYKRENTAAAEDEETW